MKTYLLFSLILFIQTPSINNFGWAACSTKGHFTSARIEIDGDLSCSDSNWGFPEIKISEYARVIKFEISTLEVQKEKLKEFKSVVLGIDDLNKEELLKHLTLGEKLLSSQSVSYSDYKQFQEKYIAITKELSDRNKQELSVFFKWN